MNAMFVDMYDFTITGEVACTVTAGIFKGASHSGPSLLIMDDGEAYGFDVYNMSMNDRVFKTLNSVATDSDHVPVVLMNDAYTMNERQISMMVQKNKANTIAATDYKGVQILCYEENNEYQGDPQFTLSAAHEHGVCYAIEGNVVDRVSNKNGKGWCEDVSPTLNTQDRHAVVFALEGNGARPSHQGSGFNGSGKMYTLNTIEQHSVCYAVDCRNNVLNEEMSSTLQSKEQGGWSVNVTNPVLYENEQKD